MSDEMDEIWALYLDDGTQSLDQMEAALLALQDGDEASAGEHVGALFRAVHTFKGNSRVLGLATVESRAHLSEDLIGLVRDEGVPLDDEILDILLYAGDVLREMLESTSANRADVDGSSSEDLMEQLRDKIARCKGEDPVAAEEPVAEPVADEPVAEEPVEEAVEPEPAPVAEEPKPVVDETPEPSVEEETAEAPAEEQVTEDTAPTRLIDDPSYRDIFRGMSDGAIAKLRELSADGADADIHAKAVKEADNLHHAASQMGLPEWAETLEAFMGQPASDGAAAAEQISALISRLEELTRIDLSDGEPEPEPEEERVTADTPIQSVSKRLIDDASYRDIFRGMSDGAIAKFQKLMSAYAGDVSGTYALAMREAGDLHHAAVQMGLTEWAETLDTFMGQPESDADTGVEQIAALVLRLEELTRIDLCDEEIVMETSSDGNFFDAVKDALALISDSGINWIVGEAPDHEKVAKAAERILACAEGRGLIRVGDAAKRISAAGDAKAFQNAELYLYEELAAVEGVLKDEAVAASISPLELLRSWCAEHAFDTLAAVDASLIGLKKGIDVDKQYSVFSRQMRLIFHACIHHKLETAGQLAMSLIDLFGRVQTSHSAPDSILMHIARGFTDTIELVFDALEQGEIPDTQNLDILFEQASNAAFAQEGLLTATAIERRLRLPDEFHRVLSPESVRAASSAIDMGEHFYVIRTDINSDVELAESFLEWVSAEHVKNITNVTVFRDEDTLFDFLIATPMDEHEVIASLTEMDPSGKYLSVEHVLEDHSADDNTAERKQDKAEDGDAPISQGPGLTSEMLESISEVAASQAMVNHMLSDLAETGLSESVEAALRMVDQDLEAGRSAVRKVVADFATRLQEAAQVEAQLVSQMAHLQEQTVAIRSRPLDMLTRPLEALVGTLTRKNRTEAKLTSAGGQMSIDVTLMEHLRKMLRVLLTQRLTGEMAPQNLHMAFHRDDERVLVTIEDDGEFTDGAEIRTKLDAQLKATSNEMRLIELPGGKGMRFHISMPLAMVVLEGMVVGIGGIRYVIPVDTIQSIIQPQIEALRPISAASGRMVLRMEDGKMVTVHAMDGRQNQSLKGLDDNGNRRVFVILGTGGKTLAVPVDELLGQQLVLLRPLKGVLRQMRNLTGIALLAGGEVGMVLSTNSLMLDAVEAA